MWSERTMGNHCYSSFPGFTISGNVAGIQVTATLCAFYHQLRVVGALLCPGEQKGWEVGRQREGEEAQWLTICSVDSA